MVEKLAEALLNKEVLFQSDVEELIGKRPFEEKKLLDDDEVKTDLDSPEEIKENAMESTQEVSVEKEEDNSSAI